MYVNIYTVQFSTLFTFHATETTRYAHWVSGCPQNERHLFLVALSTFPSFTLYCCLFLLFCLFVWLVCFFLVYFPLLTTVACMDTTQYFLPPHEATLWHCSSSIGSRPTRARVLQSCYRIIIILSIPGILQMGRFLRVTSATHTTAL